MQSRDFWFLPHHHSSVIVHFRFHFHTSHLERQRDIEREKRNGSATNPIHRDFQQNIRHTRTGRAGKSRRWMVIIRFFSDICPQFFFTLIAQLFFFGLILVLCCFEILCCSCSCCYACTDNCIDFFCCTGLC